MRTRKLRAECEKFSPSERCSSRLLYKGGFITPATRTTRKLTISGTPALESASSFSNSPLEWPRGSMRRATSFLLFSALVSTACAAEPLNCIVQPTRGSVLETSFLLGCTGGEENAPLRVYLRDHGGSDPYLGRLVHVLPGPGAYRVKLPMGDAEQSYAMVLHVHGAHSPPTNITVIPPHQCEPLSQLVATRGGDVPVGSSVHPTLSVVAVAASYAVACGHSPDSTLALLLPLLETARVRTPLQLEHGAEALRALGIAIAGKLKDITTLGREL
ncbi:hypothetical protein MRX96_049231 [Rhipicephalus microplus]